MQCIVHFNPFCSQFVVWEVPSIKRGLLVASSEPGEQGLWRLKTEGVNIQVSHSRQSKQAVTIFTRRNYGNTITFLTSEELTVTIYTL